MSKLRQSNAPLNSKLISDKPQSDFAKYGTSSGDLSDFTEGACWNRLHVLTTWNTAKGTVPGAADIDAYAIGDRLYELTEVRAPDLPTLGELTLLRCYVDQRTRATQNEIDYQDDKAPSILLRREDIFNLNLSGDGCESTRNLLEWVDSRIDIPLLRWKRHYNRARPYQFWGNEEIKAWFFPGHPSYPSGHATNGYFLYYLFALLVESTKYKARLDRLKQAIDGYATNRERAGVHYLSDTMAGERLAKDMLGLLRSDVLLAAEFEPLFRAAHDELKSHK